MMSREFEGKLGKLKFGDLIIDADDVDGEDFVKIERYVLFRRRSNSILLPRIEPRSSLYLLVPRELRKVMEKYGIDPSSEKVIKTVALAVSEDGELELIYSFKRKGLRWRRVQR